MLGTFGRRLVILVTELIRTATTEMYESSSLEFYCLVSKLDSERSQLLLIVTEVQNRFHLEIMSSI